MENLPKRGRPRKIPEPKAAGYGLTKQTKQVGEMLGLLAPTERTHANAYYADGARGVIENYIKQGVEIPEDPLRAARVRVGMDWILTKKTVLTELGRMMVEEPTEQDMWWFQGTVDYVADKHKKLGAKGAVAYIRRMRLGETKKRKARVAALHHDLNAAINLHRQRHPESSWEDIQQPVRCHKASPSAPALPADNTRRYGRPFAGGPRPYRTGPLASVVPHKDSLPGKPQEKMRVPTDLWPALKKGLVRPKGHQGRRRWKIRRSPVYLSIY